MQDILKGLTKQNPLRNLPGVSDNHEIMTRFQVQGFKNFTKPVVLEDLGRINVIHGLNNVGKSNLLQALHLTFEVAGLNYGSINNSRHYKDIMGFSYGKSFHFARPSDIVFELSGTGQQGLPDYFNFPYHKNDAEFDNYLLGIRAIYEKTKVPDSFKPHPFALLETTRHFAGESKSETNQIVPQTLRDRLFDLRNSGKTDQARKWELFTEALKPFHDLLGDGFFDLMFTRQSNKADIVFDVGDMRLPVDDLGTGIQQIIALLGQLLLTDAPFVGIEEPELNLRYALQIRLRRSLESIVNSDYGPRQLFLTSHSPAFETEEYFYAMELDDDGTPTIKKRPSEEAVHDLEYVEALEGLSWKKHAKGQGYVTTDGLLRLPPMVVERLKLENGGGIFFLTNKDTKRFEVWHRDEVEDRLFGEEDA